MQDYPRLPDFPLNLPTVHTVHTTVSVVTVAVAKDLIASGELKLDGAKKLFNPAVWPHLEPELQRIPCDQPKTQCFTDCVDYLSAEATALRSERRYFDALRHIDVALRLEALIYDGYMDV